MIFEPAGKDDLLMTDSAMIYRYIHAGRGYLTLVAPSGKAHQYAFLKPKNREDFEEGTIFVYVVHEGHNIYLGMLNGALFRLTRGSKFDDHTEAVKGAKYIVKLSMRQQLLDETPMKLYHSGKCCKCGRKLWGKKSIEAGIGKKCLKIYEEELLRGSWDGNS